MKLNLFIGAAALALGLASAPAMAQDIDTTGTYGGDISSFGTPNTATYGQTFTVGAENALNSFTMYLDSGSGGALNFQAYVYAWTGSRAVGNALFASTTQQFNGSSYGNPVAFDFNTGSLNLVSGQQYVAFVTTAGVANSGYASAYMPFNGWGTDTYAGGDFVYFNNGTDFAQLTARNWDCTGCGFGDAHFKADFTAGISAVPEPAAWGMLIGGFGLAGGMMRSRARKGRTAIA
ncbi:PEPxxWA-CTERM sorting domain-containing protein [Sphingomonas sp. JC676]|uniref:PEPxxWA-CTERM sorting domain-containing protein n=1 Tax=Sphingomonas sp. JC676 TaxID=2768065 RepID=UPI0016586747|nr:PEPxxWA-CTERM sorting domain-containing protein [Sphingomonas sp. JC676]MBC9034685.1 PEPxxWA-CTERM sorting domain-containing protein [Sphingomonas sp. JC676]